WMDTDTGFDDFAAIMVPKHADLVIDGISRVYGNAPVRHGCRHSAAVASAFVWSFPIHVGRANPVLARLETATSILGDAGMPTTGLHLPETADALHRDGFEALCPWLEKDDGERRVLALGPLTNVAALALAQPGL